MLIYTVSIIDKIDQLPVNESLNHPTEQQELEQALKKHQTRKESRCG